MFPPSGGKGMERDESFRFGLSLGPKRPQSARPLSLRTLEAAEKEGRERKMATEKERLSCAGSSLLRPPFFAMDLVTHSAALPRAHGW
jgi:hypothetical protein